MEALLDAGRSVMIISLKWLLQFMAKQPQKDQSPNEWKAKVKNQQEPTTIVLHNYSGDRCAS